MPMPSSGLAAMSEATAVPWPSASVLSAAGTTVASGVTVQRLSILPARSGMSAGPVSIIPTTIAGEPCDSSRA
jgi:hypothetical protein